MFITLIILTAIFDLTQIMDFYTTHVILTRGGEEKNIIVAWMIRTFGLDIGLTIAKVGAILMITDVSFQIPQTMITEWCSVLVCLIVWYIKILFYNYRSMPR